MIQGVLAKTSIPHLLVLISLQNQKDGVIEVAKVDGRYNPADMFTKQVPGEIMWRHMMVIGYANREGRAESAIQLVGN